MLTLIFSVFFAILCGVIADNKNRNVTGWVIAGLLFGVFAFIILLFVKKV